MQSSLLYGFERPGPDSICVSSLIKGIRVHSFLFFPQYEYFNAVLINELDEDGNSVELGGEFILQPNDHFNNLSVNLSLSVVQVPTNMYNKGTSFLCYSFTAGGLTVTV